MTALITSDCNLNMHRRCIQYHRYILLKTQVSLLTGLLVMTVLWFFELRMWFVWAVLSFIL